MEVYEQELRRLVLDGMSHALISHYLSQKEPNHRGYSERCVHWFGSERNIHYWSRLRDTELDRRVMLAIQSVGHKYGRWTLQGYLCQSVHVSQRRVGASLSRVAPQPPQVEEHKLIGR